jgi:hypothetical protein
VSSALAAFACGLLVTGRARLERPVLVANR